jgi:hypothetical protein
MEKRSQSVRGLRDSKGTTENGILAGIWKELAVCWVKLDKERSHMHAQGRVHGA